MITVAGSFVYLLFFAFGVILFIKENNSVFDFSTASLVWSVFYIMSILLIVAVGSTVRHLVRFFFFHFGEGKLCMKSSTQS